MTDALEVALSDGAHVRRVVCRFDLELARKLAVGGDEGLKSVNSVDIARESVTLEGLLM